MVYNSVRLTGKTPNLHYEAEPVKHLYSGNYENHINSKSEQKIFLVVQEKVYTDVIVLL